MNNIFTVNHCEHNCKHIQCAINKKIIIKPLIKYKVNK